MPSSDTDLLARLEQYYDEVPRTAADVEECGPFTLFRSRAGWPYYARPRLGLTQDITSDDVRALRQLQMSRDVPETIEWVPATTPSLGRAAAGAGLHVSEFPLMVLGDSAPPSAPVAAGFEVRLLAADDPSLVEVMRAVHRGFGSEGGPDEAEISHVRTRISAGLQVVAAAFDSGGQAVGGGAHQPVGAVTELVGIAILESHRRRGLGAAITDALVKAAGAAGVDIVFLSAGDDAVARTYARVGFRVIGAAGSAEPATA